MTAATSSKSRAMPLRFRLEGLMAKRAMSWIDNSSLKHATTICRRIADMWYAADIRRQRLAICNIMTSGIAENRSSASRIARNSFRHFAVMLIESLKAREQLTPDNWRDFTAIEIPDETMELFRDPDQGVLLVSGHLGNWEIAAHLLSCIKPVAGITRTMKNPLVEEIIQQRKPGVNFSLVPKRDANAGRFLQVLNKGHILALLMDQYARDRGVMIPFFGRPASTHASPAMLHLVTHAPLCFGYCVRTGPLSYLLKADRPLSVEPSGNKTQDVENILTSLTSRLETAITEYPEQYLWAHRRWR